MVEKKIIVASGPVIIENGKLLLDRDYKDDFWKFIGGRVKEGESFEERCLKRAKEELNAEVKIIRPLSPLVLWKNPQTGEEMQIILVHWLCNLKNKLELKVGDGIKEFSWIDIKDIKSGKINVAPNVKFLIKKGDIK